MEAFQTTKETNIELLGKKKFRSRRKGKYIILSPAQKEKCIEEIPESGIKNVAFKYGVDIQSIQRWITHGIRRKEGCGRKIYSLEMEKKLVEWCIEMFKTHDIIRSDDLKQKACELSGDPHFKASNGWLDKFKKRNNIQIGKKRNRTKKELQITL